MAKRGYHRFNNRGSFVIDRRYKGIGRIRRASNTKDKKTFEEILHMLTRLLDLGQHEILKEIRDGVLSPMEVYGYWTNDQLLRGAGKGLSRSIEDMGFVEVASDDMGLALAAVEIGAHRALQVLS